MSKTAMQELINYMKPYFYLTHEILQMFDEALEKEKEQIIDAMERTAMYVSAASLDKEIGKMTFEDLYNQTYENTNGISSI
jgi:hypothetical protein